MGYVTDPLEGGWGDGGWSPGQTHRLASIACCPSCGSSEVQHKGGREPGAELVYWLCVPCGHRWKSPDRKQGRAITIQ